jgi:hypothetical protein
VHPAVGLVELEATRLEIEPTERQDAAHVRFEIGHNTLMLDAQDLAGERAVRNAIRELLPRGEQLFEVTEATRAPRCNRYRHPEE